MSGRHPGEETLGRYALGGLGPGARLTVAAHLKTCPACRGAVARLEVVAGALLENEAPAGLAPDSLDRTLGRLAEPVPVRRPVEIEELIERGWWLPAAPGLWFKPLSRYAGPGERLYLLKAKGGAALPCHGHEGAERLTVLKGAFRDGDRVYGPGDFAESDEAVEHEPRACPGETCVCLAATEGRLRLTGVARWLQPLLGV